MQAEINNIMKMADAYKDAQAQRKYSMLPQLRSDLQDKLQQTLSGKCLHQIEEPSPYKTFQLHDRVRKKSGSQWQGRVVGYYSTELTPEGYAVESETHKGSVQIYPAKALELAGGEA